MSDSPSRPAPPSRPASRRGTPSRPGTPSRRATLSACIIARDEAARLPECLASVAFCDEVVLVDSGSADDTIALARAAGARVFEQEWLGFPGQRNVALGHATGDWVLEIDADERVTPQLRDEIVTFLADPPPEVEMCAIPLRNMFLGRGLGPSAKYPEYRRRMFRRGRYSHDEARVVHESLVPRGPVHPFDSDLEHLFADSMREAVTDAWRYARLEAGQMDTRVTPLAVLRGGFVRPGVKFAYRLLIDGGWRDGWRGAVRVAIDCAIDSTVWIRHAIGRRGTDLGTSGVRDGEHYGATNFRAGVPRVVAVCSGSAAHRQALRWLEQLASQDLDVTLVSDFHDSAADAESRERPAVRIRRVRAMRPLPLIRALDAEQQLRSMDAVCAVGERARIAMRVVPPALKGRVKQPAADADPVLVRRDLETHLNGGEATSGQAPAQPRGSRQTGLIEVDS